MDSKWNEDIRLVMKVRIKNKNVPMYIHITDSKAKCRIAAKRLNASTVEGRAKCSKRQYTKYTAEGRLCCLRDYVMYEL
jgi:hypothetical protein